MVYFIQIFRINIAKRGIKQMKNYILKISLDDTNIWRKVALPCGYSFPQLHDIIQTVFGWENYHLHEWRAAGMLIIADEGDDEDIIEEKFKYESDVSLDLILMNERKITYSYDFGDCWDLTIDVEQTDADGLEYPQLLEYGGTMAMEDCGGIAGLEEQDCEAVNSDELNLILKSTFEI